ncbi:hypothetical protein DSO57_1030434 [Entomophthora muscae]|uniref:Uncharacterized protein n=1 Tax=Entomophthora muscae TaxID=34485 RepID=A0ACC2TZ45_9FUNG|nr:hypothetical protein DSO57_1030434 [Entomophthora muscae]
MEQVLNPGHNLMQATSPDNQGAGYPRFLGIETSQTWATNAFLDEDTSEDLKVIELIIGLRSTLVAKKDPPLDEDVDLKALFKIINQEQKGNTTLPKNPSH